MRTTSSLHACGSREGARKSASTFTNVAFTFRGHTSRPRANRTKGGKCLSRRPPFWRKSITSGWRRSNFSQAVQPLNGKGLLGLTKLYQSMGESQRLQRVSLSRSSYFSGLEVVEDPYALTHWYREVSWWVQCYAKDPIKRVVLALKTL